MVVVVAGGKAQQPTDVRRPYCFRLHASVASLYRPLPTQDKQEMHFHVESLGEPITSSTGKRTEYQTGTVRVESGHVMKALFFHPTKVTENSFYYRGKGP